MSDSQEKSDDLIAELAKLMASNAQGSESEPKPTVIKLAPLSDATVPSPAPIRIPGMEAPAAPAASAAPAPAPTIRIPGMEKPAGVEMPAPTQEVRPEPKPQPSAPIDFGKSPSANPVVVPGPVSGWQTRDVPKPAPEIAVPPLAQTPQQPAAARVEPAIAPAPAAAAPQAPMQAKPSPAAEADSFNFDFGFGSDSQPSGERAQTPAPHAESPKAAPALAHDPIADLIAAELDAAQAEPVAAEPAKQDAIPAATVFPPSVEAVPARNFGNTTAGQAPVLIARPVGVSAQRATPTSPTAFKPLPQTPRPAESDKFAVAPVFGLGGRTSPAPQPAPAAAPAPVPSRSPVAAPEIKTSPSMLAASDAARHDTDPMDEIESLIGEAVRVELSTADKPVAVAPQPQVHAPVAPVVPPLTTGFAPRRAGLKESEPQVRSAEAAILAAAAATGAEVGRIDGEANEDRPYKRGKIRPPKANISGGIRQYVGLAVAGTLLLAAGFGLYWVLGMGRGDGTAPVLTADATPAKQPPAATVAETAEPARSVVFDEIDGVAAADSAETLVSRDETEGASVADVARVVTPEAATTESGLANRKVRTVTVRPDGTIVSGDEAVAGSEALPVERPNVPAVPGASVEPSDLLAAAVTSDAPAATDPAQPAQADPIAAAIAEGGGTEAAPLEVAALAPTDATPTVFDASIVAPVPMPRPADRSALNAGGAPVAAPAAAGQSDALAALPLVDLNEPAAEAAPAASGGTAAAYVQLSSQRSEADAQASLRNAQSRWGNLLGSSQLEIQRADLGQKGVYYRVRVPASSLQEATQICASIKADGGDCFATNG